MFCSVSDLFICIVDMLKHCCGEVSFDNSNNIIVHKIAQQLRSVGQSKEGLGKDEVV